MKQKMLFFDIDGTLITEGSHILPKSTMASIRQARANGHLAFINTGRTFFNVTDQIKEIGFDGYVCGCGTYIHYKGEEILWNQLTKKRCREIVELIRSCNLDALLEGKEGVYFDYTRPSNPTIAKLQTRFGAEQFSERYSWDSENLQFDKFVIWQTPNSDFSTFFNNISKDFDYIDRENGFGEIVPKGYSKASGIEFLEKYLNIPHENCFAFGDSTNDLSMLEYVPNSIAMGNSSKLILPKVSYITTDIEDNGIENALKNFNII